MNGGPAFPENSNDLEKLKYFCYGLLAPFLDGMIEAAGPNVTIIDGTEQAYTTVRRQAFARPRHAFEQDVLPFVADDARYHQVFQLGFGIWADANWGRDPLDASYHDVPADGRGGSSCTPSSSPATPRPRREPRPTPHGHARGLPMPQLAFDGSPRDTLTCACGLELIRIEPGTFLMGSPPHEPGHTPDEAPQRRTALSRLFAIGVYPVTQDQYAQVMGRCVSKFPSPDRPVEMVSHIEAELFCRKLSERDGTQSRGLLPRQPTELVYYSA